MSSHKRFKLPNEIDEEVLEAITEAYPGAEIYVDGNDIVFKNFCDDGNIDWSIIFNDKMIWSKKIAGIGKQDCDDAYKYGGTTYCLDVKNRPACFFIGNKSVLIDNDLQEIKKLTAKKMIQDGKRGFYAIALAILIARVYQELGEDAFNSFSQNFLRAAIYSLIFYGVDYKLFINTNELDTTDIVSKILSVMKSGALRSAHHVAFSSDGNHLYFSWGRYSEGNCFIASGIDAELHRRIIALRPKVVSDETFLSQDIEQEDVFIPDEISFADIGFAIKLRNIDAENVEIYATKILGFFSTTQGNRIKTVADFISSLGKNVKVIVTKYGNQSYIDYKNKMFYSELSAYDMESGFSYFFDAWFDSDDCFIETVKAPMIHYGLFEVTPDVLKNVYRTISFCPESLIEKANRFEGDFHNISSIVEKAKEGATIESLVFSGEIGGDCVVTPTMLVDKTIDGKRYVSFSDWPTGDKGAVFENIEKTLAFLYLGRSGFLKAVATRFQGGTIKVDPNGLLFYRDRYVADKHYWLYQWETAFSLLRDFYKYIDLSSTTLLTKDGSKAFVKNGVLYYDVAVSYFLGDITLAAGLGIHTVVFETGKFAAEALEAYRAGLKVIGAKALPPHVRAQIWDGIEDEDDESLFKRYPDLDISNYALLSGCNVKEGKMLALLFKNGTPVVATSGAHRAKESDIALMQKVGDRLKELYSEYIVPLKAFGLSIDEPSEYRNRLSRMFEDKIDEIIGRYYELFNGKTIHVTFKYGAYSRTVHINIDEITAEDAVVKNNGLFIRYGNDGVVDSSDDLFFGKLTEDQTVSTCYRSGGTDEDPRYSKYKYDAMTLDLLYSKTDSTSCWVPPKERDNRDKNPPRVVYSISENSDGSLTVTYNAYDEEDNDITDRIKTLTLGDRTILRNL